jgi:hypothetical protein
VEWIRNTPTPSGPWQDLKVYISGAKVEGYLNGKLYLEHTLPAPVSGKISVWSKADSVVYFDDYRVRPAPHGRGASVETAKTALNDASQLPAPKKRSSDEVKSGSLGGAVARVLKLP